MADRNSIKCLRDIRSVPPQVYSLPTDGRQHRHLCSRRRELAMQLATYADSNGNNIWPSSFTLARDLGLTRRAVTSLLKDLRTLRFVEDAGFHVTGKIHTRQRILNVANILAAAAPAPDTAQSSDAPQVTDTAQSSSDTGQSCADTAQSSGYTAQSCYCAQPTVVPAPVTDHQPATQNGAGGWWKKHIETMNVPGKNQARELETIGAQHSSEVASRGVELLLERGLGNARNPWAVFISGAEAWIQKAAQERLDENRKAKEAEIVEANIARQKAEEVAFMYKAPAPENGGDANEFFAQYGG